MQLGLQTFLLLSFSLLSLVLSWSGRAYGGWSWNAYATTLDPTVIYAGLPVGDKPRAVPSSFETGSTLTHHRVGSSHGQLLEVSSRNAWLTRDTGLPAAAGQAGLASTWQRVCHLVVDIYTYVSYSTVDEYPIETKDPSLNPPDPTVITNSQDAAAAGLASTWQRVCHLVADIYTYISYSTVDEYPTETKDTPNQTVITNSQDAAAAGRVPDHARGSCMAVVVSLAVGVMWF